MEQQNYMIEYIKIDEETLKKITTLEIQCAIDGNEERLFNLKKSLLKKLGIELRDGEKPIDAYTRYLCEINKLPFTKPVERGLADTIATIPAAMRMLYILA